MIKNMYFLIKHNKNNIKIKKKYKVFGRKIKFRLTRV